MSRKITLKSPLAADQLLIRAASVTEQLGRLFEIDLDLLSPDESLDFDKLLGKEITLSVLLDDGSQRHFHAYIAEFGQTGRLGDYASYRARAVPWLWFLTRTADCRIFQNLSVPEIVKQVFKEQGYTNVKDTLTKSYRKREYCVQYRETDFNFVQRLMEEEGIYYYFKHTASTHTLVLADSYSGHESFASYETIEYFPPSENAQREKDHIHDWQRQRNVQPGKYVVMDYDFTKPRAQLKTQYVQKRDFPKSDAEMFDYPGGFTVSGDGDHYARARLESLQAQYELQTGVGNARGLATGYLFKLDGYPRKDQNKEYLIVGAVHRVHAGDYESGTAGTPDDYTCSFDAIDAKEPFRTPITTRKPAVGGPQTATVTGPSGEEIHTDKYGRVKVQFHWDREGQRDEKSSCWVRVSQIWAGKNWGWMSIPRIGQEVVVDFLEGDPDQPIITGRVYNADNMPPFELPGNKTQSGLRTRSTLNGTADNCNEIRFEDKKGSEQLFMHAEKNQDIEVENDETHWVGHDRTKTIDNDETTHVKHDRTETVDNNETITIHGTRTETVDKDESITIGAGRTENVAKNETISIGQDRSESVGGSESVSIGKDQSVSIGANRSLSVGKDENITISANRTDQVGKNVDVTVGKTRSTSVGENESLTVAKGMVIDVGDQITIKTGSASITMKKDGTITIKGKDITLDGSGKINVKASSDIAIKGSKVTQN
ncbi:MAG TPA: type VI secretion system tip protein TssI/VgrG [Povalibacter sp.]|uniref:type VI secretion system Vgr family protein n=1 Tax=Povalibacter sp. TaxID=1962978 RepID=UPI002C2DCE95|nr:type VI secretion system tip protein TssI/VgrG [Povalibacter sp.]HMN43948.1 type VI secretion system tip protein TssI/VgrG [Povalibacter sp.]